MRAVAARIRAGHRERREGVIGLPAQQRLFRVRDAGGRTLELPPAGLVVSTALADALAVGVGDTLTIEVLEGRRPVVRAPVAATFETYLGTPAYMEIGALNRLLRERPSASGAHLRVDARELSALLRAVRDVPQAAAISLRRAAIDVLHETMGRSAASQAGPSRTGSRARSRPSCFASRSWSSPPRTRGRWRCASPRPLARRCWCAAA
jgi:putative ABC transport system permease protein